MGATTATVYETIYILRSGATDTDATTIHQKVDNVIAKFEGALAHRDDWGKREFAYLINKETHGRYTVIGYTGKPGVVEEIERHFRISDDVVRFLTVAVEGDYDYAKVKTQMAHAEEEMKQNREAREQRKRMQ